MGREQLRRKLATAFPGSFLLQKRCRCTVHVYGNGPSADVAVAACGRCQRYARVRRRRGA